MDISQQEKVFVYGRQVNDFHSVDYEAISMLNVSATQELAKQLDELKAENAALKAKLSEIEALKQQMAQMQAFLEQMQQQNNRPKVNAEKAVTR